MKKTALLFGLAALACVPATFAFAQMVDEQKPDGAVILRNQLSKDDPLDPKTRGFRKEYLIDLEAGRAYELQLGSAGKAFRPHLRVEEESGKVLEQDSADLIREKATLTILPLANAKYRVVVTSVADGELGPYALSIRRTEGEAMVEVAGLLANTDPFDNVRQGCHQKVHVQRMFASRTYTIDLEGQFDTYIRIENSAGKNLAEDDDGGDNLNSRLTFRPEQNDHYRVIVTSCGPNAVGPYKLRIRSDAGTKVVFKAQSQLNGQDPLDKVRQGSRCKIFDLKMEARRTYTIDLESDDFDSYLRLEDAAGKNLAEDDDGGNGLNSRLVFQATQSGVYRVIATTLGGGQTGNFTLAVRQN